MVSGSSEDNGHGYILAKLEAIDQRMEAMTTGHNQRMDAMTGSQRELSSEVTRLRLQVDEYTAQFRAVRWMGMAAIAIVLTFKTGDIAALKSIFGSGN